MFSLKSYYSCITNIEFVQNSKSKPKKLSFLSTFKPIGENLWATGELQLSAGLIFAHQWIPLGAPLAQYKLSWSKQKLCRLSLHDTNITPLWNNRCNRQAALNSSLFNYTLLVIRGLTKIAKPMQTGMNSNK